MKYFVMILLGVSMLAFFVYSVYGIIKDIKSGKFRFSKKKQDEKEPSNSADNI